MCSVSVIVPVYNVERYIERCIRSLLAQSWKDIEILAIDDGSTDGSGGILDALAEEDGRVRALHQKNGGVGAARNYGLDEARGEFLTFVDGDDYVNPDYIRHLLLRARERNAQMVLCGVTYVTESGKAIRELIPDRYESGVHEEWLFRIAGVWAHFYRRELWEQYHFRFHTGERGEDLPVALFFAGVCSEIAILPEAGYNYVQHEGSAMHSFRGLRKYRLPYDFLEEAVQMAQRAGIVNGKDFFELFVLRIFASFYFDLARGTSREKMQELCDYILRMLSTYFPAYAGNPLTRVFSGLCLPLSQRLAVWLLVLLSRTGTLRTAGRLICLL